jgi:hypothetical protein
MGHPQTGITADLQLQVNMELEKTCSSILGLPPTVEQARTCEYWRRGSLTGRSVATVGGLFSVSACEKSAKKRYPEVRDIAVRVSDGVCTFKDPTDCTVSFVSEPDGDWQVCSLPPLLIPIVLPVIPVLDGEPIVDTELLVRKNTVPQMLEDLYHDHHGGWDFESLIINKYHVKVTNVADADGWTAAHWAVYFGKPEHLGALINIGADILKPSTATKMFDKGHSGLGSSRISVATNSPSHDFEVAAGSVPRDIVVERYKNRLQNQLTVNTFMSKMLHEATVGSWGAWKAAHAHTWNSWRTLWRSLDTATSIAYTDPIESSDEAVLDAEDPILG